MYFQLLFYFPSLSVVQCILISFTTIYLKNIKQIRRTLMVFKNYNMVVVTKCQICARVLPKWFSMYLLPPPKSFVVCPLNTPLKKKKQRLREIQWLVPYARQTNGPLSKDVHSISPAACEYAPWQRGSQMYWWLLTYWPQNRGILPDFAGVWTI